MKIHLIGWINPLPDYIVKAIQSDTITIHKGKGFQYLLGETTYPNSKTIVSFK